MERNNAFNTADRTALIAGLAEAMGVTENIDPRHTESRYDDVTGTYYCDGIPLPHGSMENIKNWYKAQMESYRGQASEGGVKRDYFMRYAVAYNAICLLQTTMAEK